MKKVIIFGAGPAGLTTAYELLGSAESYSVIILEAADEVGGISRTVRHNGNRMDIGGHRFFSKDDTIMAWWRSMMPIQGADALDDKLLGRVKDLEPSGPDPEVDDRVMLVRNRISRIYYLRKFFDYPVTLKTETLKNMGFFRTVKVGLSYLKACLLKKEENSLEDFYINRFGRVLYGMFFEGYTEKVWGRHPSKISADWGSQRVKGLSVVAILKDMFKKASGNRDVCAGDIRQKDVETSLIEQFLYPKFGPGQLWETVADEVVARGGVIRMNSKVEEVVVQNGLVTGVRCVVEGKSEIIEGDIFVSSIPLKDLVGGISPKAAVPQGVLRIADGLPYRDFVTVGLLVKRLNLKNETKVKTLGNTTPDCWIYVQEDDVKIGRLQIFNNWSPYMTPDPSNTVWVGLEYFCEEGDRFWEMGERECVNFAISELIKLGILTSVDDVLDSHRERVKKAYPAYFGTYSEISTLIGYLDSLSNLYCVGRNGQHRYNNMDHSMMTAMLTVDAIRKESSDKKAIWDVNTEAEYQEERQLVKTKCLMN